MTCAVLLAIPAIALADNVASDGDDLAALSNSDLAFGSVDCNVAKDKTVPVFVTRQGSGTNVFKDGASVTVAVQSVTGAGLSAQMGTPDTITLPADWGDKDNGTQSSTVSSTVTINSSVAGSGTGTVNYTATGQNINGDTITRPDAMKVTWTTGSCTPPDTTPPGPPSTPDLVAASDSGSLNTDDITNDNKPDFSGTAEANSTVELFAGAISLGSVTADSSGNWSFDGDTKLTSALADDTYSITAKATDAAGNTSSASGALSLTIDTVANAPTGLDLTTDTGSSSTDNVTNDNTPTIDGSAEAKGSVELFEGTTSLGTGSANNSGGWSITSSPLSNGQHTLKAKVTDVAGNVSNLSNGLVVTIDTVNPLVTINSGISNGGQYDFGSVPADPGCSATDIGGSGVAGTCQTSGYSNAAGNHTLVGTAYDVAGNQGTASVSYSVAAWNLAGFKSPVDMGIYNDAKGGSTVPLKFEVFQTLSGTELTSTSVVNYFTQKVNCASGDGDAIEQYSTGNTELRYDTISGQFIFNWKTPKAPGSCYRVTLQTDEGSSIYADFRLK